jgi:hypothetical protein
MQPLAFFAASAAFVLSEISSRSYWASAASKPMVRVFASGISQAMNFTSLSRNLKMNATEQTAESRPTPPWFATRACRFN